MGRREGPAPSHGLLRGSGANRPGLEGLVRERLATLSPAGSGGMKENRSIPARIRAALRPTSPHCYRHCSRPVHGRALATSLPGFWQVYACPGGAVSVASYAHWSDADPTPQVRAYLARHTLPRSLVKSRDLRVATRHGPELGRAAERLLKRARPLRSVRVVYWRVYPFEGRRGVAQRLFACFRHGRARPVFFPFHATADRPLCPVCQKPRATSQGMSR
jgi:hypothetical protein